MERTENLRAFILGASGAVGRELVLELLKSPKWSQVTVLVRRNLEEWDSLPTEQKQKLHIILQENLDGLSDHSKWDLKGYSTVFCCLGVAARAAPDDVFTQVNCTYPLNGAKVASLFKVPHFSLVSGEGISSSSLFAKLKERGVMEDKLVELKFPHLSIFKPGVISDRRQNSRVIEKLVKYIPILPNVPVGELAAGLRIDAELQHSVSHEKSTVIYHNGNIRKLAQSKKYPKGI